MSGVVTKISGSWTTVRTDDGRLFLCKVKGSFRIRGIRTTNPVAVGDRVDITVSPDGETALITAVHERRNYIIRKASNLSKQSHILACNLDRVLLVVTLRHPETSTVFIDRFLATAEAYRVPVVVCFNKCDLLSQEEQEELRRLRALYESLGYETCAVSALDPSSLSLGSLEGLTLLSGNSGVGKTTLLNALCPELELKTAAISEAHLTGMHTTTFSEMYALPESVCPAGGAVIDTPGIKGFGTFDMEPEEVSHYFREIFAVGRECRFGNCLHTREPGCRVIEAVEEGRIALSRYESYLSMLEDKGESKYRE
ncbi:MAG: ribosome small subunit-dependent GTPase A [Bacteroidaceae bacterium]|nr:ribosome small subunit-dependent GTPase A [Bacteroidaceae bacterium]